MTRRMQSLIVVFVVLLGFMFLQRQQHKKIVAAGPAQTVKIEADKVTKVEIHGKDGDVELVRTGEEWKLTKPLEYPANTDMIKGMLKSVEELKLEDVISSNPANRTTYEVDSTGTAVKIWTGDKLALSAIIGKASTDYTHTYLRYADRDEVYRAGGVISYNFNHAAKDWRDKSILKLEEKQIQKIVLEYPKDKPPVVVTLARADSTHWNLQSGAHPAARADSTAAARVASNVARLNTVEFATPEETAGKDWSAPDFRLRVDAGGAPHVVSFISVDENRTLAKADGSDVVFTLFKGNLVNIMRKAEELEPGYKPPAPAAPKPPKMAAKAPGKAAKAKKS